MTSAFSDRTLSTLKLYKRPHSPNQFVSTTHSRIYIAKLARTSAALGASDMVFMVSDEPRNPDLLFPYRSWLGGSKTPIVANHRPTATCGTAAGSSVFSSGYLTVRWLQADGCDVSYLFGMDTAQYHATELVPRSRPNIAA